MEPIPQGDSGGPLVTVDQDNNLAATLIGVVSWGFGCADVDSLGVYAEVSHFSSWLQETMPDLSTCPPPSLSTWSVPALQGSSEDGLKESTTTATTTTTTTTTLAASLSLTGGNNQFEGTVLLGGRPICDDHWSVPNARVVCRQLGFSGGHPVQESGCQEPNIDTKFLFLISN